MPLLKRSDMHAYQEHGVELGLNNDRLALWMLPGLGKTITTLTIVDVLINHRFEVSKVLIVAPKKVAESVWDSEIHKWEHVRHLRFSKVMGNERQRLDGLRAEADVYIINRDNIVWLVGLLKFNLAKRFQLIVIDESGSFKNHNSNRFKALDTYIGAVPRVLELTGTPSPNGAINLWSQIHLLDGGKRLGKNISAFREAYCRSKGSGYTTWEITNDAAKKEIYSKLEDICFSMLSEDYLKDLPERVDVERQVVLSSTEYDQYKDFAKTKVLEILEGVDMNNEQQVRNIIAKNAVSLNGKLLQFASGAIYDGREEVDVKEEANKGKAKPFTVVHNEKLDMLEELIEEADGNPVLVIYWYKHSRDRIMERLKKYKPRVYQGDKEYKDWNAGKIEVMLGHPASMGHGLNLQAGGHNMILFDMFYDLELAQQVFARLHRQGQLSVVVLQRLISAGTIDSKVWDILMGKATEQDELLAYMKAMIGDVMPVRQLV